MIDTKMRIIEVLELEKKSHELNCQAFTNIAFGNLTESDRQKYIQQSHESTKLHAEAIDKCESLISSLTNFTLLDLRKYPSAIAELEIKIHRLDQEIAISQNNLKLVEYDIDQQVAFDASLSNDAKRKAMRVALLEMHPEYSNYEDKLEVFKNQRTLDLIEIDKLRGEFSVAKLEARERIARHEATI